MAANGHSNQPQGTTRAPSSGNPEATQNGATQQTVRQGLVTYLVSYRPPSSPNTIEQNRLNEMIIRHVTDHGAVNIVPYGNDGAAFKFDAEPDNINLMDHDLGGAVVIQPLRERNRRWRPDGYVDERDDSSDESRTDEEFEVEHEDQYNNGDSHDDRDEDDEMGDENGAGDADIPGPVHAIMDSD